MFWEEIVFDALPKNIFKSMSAQIHHIELMEWACHRRFGGIKVRKHESKIVELIHDVIIRPAD